MIPRYTLDETLRHLESTKMKSEPVVHALYLAAMGARVLYVCDHRDQVRELLDWADSPRVREVTDGEIVKVRRAWSCQSITMASGGKISVRAPNAGIRGCCYDAVFAPSRVWADEDRRRDFLISTMGSTFFLPDQPHLYSGRERIGEHL